MENNGLDDGTTSPAMYYIRVIFATFTFLFTDMVKFARLSDEFTNLSNNIAHFLNQKKKKSPFATIDNTHFYKLICHKVCFSFFVLLLIGCILVRYYILALVISNKINLS